MGAWRSFLGNVEVHTRSFFGNVAAHTMFGQKMRGQGDWLTALQGDGLTAVFGGWGQAQGDWLAV